MDSSISNSSISHLTQAISTRWAQTPTWARTTGLLLATSLSVFYTITFINNFHSWKAMGAGGLPHNFGGFLVENILAIVFAKSDTTSVEPYHDPDRHDPGFKKASENEREQARISFLAKPLEKRNGQRTHALKFVVPHRQRNANAYQNPKIKEAYTTAFKQLGDEYCPTTCDWRTSILESRGIALFLKRTFPVPTLAAPTQGEICHIHESDLSGHVTLSLADAEAVVAKGWGERHKLSGTRFAPLGWTMLYIPRTVEEVDVFVGIFRAGIEYMKSNGERSSA